MDSYFTSGDWIVKTGHDEDFIAAFRASGVDDRIPPIGGLLRPTTVVRGCRTSGHYKSYMEWESLEAVQQFRSRPDFPQMLNAMGERLDGFSIFTGRRIL